jgi:dCTP deaminase
MSFLSDREIRRYATEFGMISPFQERLKEAGQISSGLSSYGYDARLGHEFAVYDEAMQYPRTPPLDPLRVHEHDVQRFIAQPGRPFVLRAKGFVLAKTIEYIKMPPHVTGLVKDKSTYARCGIHVQNTVLEAGWEGEVTLEISNYLNRDVLLWPGQGIVQILFEESKDLCETSYAARSGKYQGQTGVTLPKIKQEQATEYHEDGEPIREDRGIGGAG